MSGHAEPADLADRLLEHVAAVAPGAQAQVTAWRSRTGLTRFANSFIHQHVGEDTTTADLKVVVDDRVVNARSTGLTTDDAIRRFVQRTVEQARLLPVDEGWPGLAPPADVPPRPAPDPSTWDADPERRAAVVDAFVQAAPDLRAAGYVDTEASEVVFRNTAGQGAAGRVVRSTLDGIHQTATSAGYAHATSQRLADLDGAAGGARAARLAREAQDTVDVAPGDHEVVLSPECVAEVVSFLAFYGFNAKEHQEGQSFARLGERQFDGSLRLVDDATDPRAIGAPFDHDGTPKRPVTLVDEGITTSLVHDRRTAARGGTTSTGHAIAGGDAWGPVPSNLFLRGDTPRPVDELVAGVERGLLVTTFNYCRILDPKTQVVTGLTRNGTFVIEDGRVTRPVSNLRFTQSFVSALGPGNVRGWGDDARFAACEFGTGIVHAPSVRLARFHFTGGAQG